MPHPVVPLNTASRQLDPNGPWFGTAIDRVTTHESGERTGFEQTLSSNPYTDKTNKTRE